MMAEMVTTELRSFLTQYKDVVSIEPDEFYKLVTISNNGIISLREVVQGKNIKADKAYRISAGSFIYSRLAAHTGSFGLVPPELDGAIVTNEMPVFEIDQDIVLSDYLLYLLRQKKFFNILFQLTKGMGRVRIKEESLLNIKLTIHKDIADQKRVVKSLDSKYDNIESLDNTHSEQNKIITQMRQALLQEAIRGKLTASWRNRHPELVTRDNQAINLLEKIIREKGELINEGKLKREKPLSLITNDEEPFNLPEEWVWCRLGDIANGFEYGSSSKSKKEGKVPVLRMGNLHNGIIVWDNLVFTDNDDEIKKYMLRPGDILFNRTNSRELVGKSSLYNDHKDAIFAGYLVRFHMCGELSSHFANFVMNSNFHRNWCNKVKSDALGQSNINATKLRNYLFPLPPVAEQIIIVEKIRNFLLLLDKLERQIEERKEQSEMLMQSVLREAFATN